MEMDPINEHECMPSVAALLKHMVRNEITPSEPKKDMPAWMKNVLDKFSNPETNLNIKLFIAKSIVNSPKVSMFSKSKKIIISVFYRLSNLSPKVGLDLLLI